MITSIRGSKETNKSEKFVTCWPQNLQDICLQAPWPIVVLKILCRPPPCLLQFDQYVDQYIVQILCKSWPVYCANLDQHIVQAIHLPSPATRPRSMWGRQSSPMKAAGDLKKHCTTCFKQNIGKSFFAFYSQEFALHLTHMQHTVLRIPAWMWIPASSLWLSRASIRYQPNRSKCF